MCLDLLIRPKIETPRNISCRKISTMVNSILQKRNEVDKLNRNILIYYKTINNYLKEYYNKERKKRKTFYLSDQIILTYESKISLSTYINDQVRLEPVMKEKLKMIKNLILLLIGKSKNLKFLSRFPTVFLLIVLVG